MELKALKGYRSIQYPPPKKNLKLFINEVLSQLIQLSNINFPNIDFPINTKNQ